MSIQQAIITLVGAIISGVLATYITLAVNKRDEKIRVRQQLVDDIFGYKYQLSDSTGVTQILDINSKGFVRALNRIPIIFWEDAKVLNAYDKFYDTLSIADEQERKEKSDEELINLLKALCKASKIDCDNWNDSRFKRVFKI